MGRCGVKFPNLPWNSYCVILNVEGLHSRQVGKLAVTEDVRNTRNSD